MRYAAVLSLVILTACGPDKFAHVGAGFIIGGAVTEATDDPGLGCGAAIIAGLFREAFGVFDPLDIVATLAGGCL
jgi:hypothetical protein